MTFSGMVKEEVSTLECSEIEKISELSGIIRTIADIKIYSIKLQTENKQVATRIFGHFSDLYDINPSVIIRKNYNFKKSEIYIIEIKRETMKVLKNLGIVSENNEFLKVPKDFLIADEEVKRAFLRGCFLASGSVNDPKKSRYHLEFLVEDKEYADFLKNTLNDFNLNSKILHRKKGYMIYIKESEKISDFLKIIKAYRAVLYFEDIRIYRDHVNMTNRLNNCEQANIDKIVNAATTQVNDINYIKEQATLDLLDEKILETAEYRLKYPEASLLELSEIITIETGQKATKSSLNHRFRKIKELANKLRKHDEIVYQKK